MQEQHLINDLTEFNQVWEKLATIEAHRQWSKDLESHVVSGTNRREIYRVL